MRKIAQSRGYAVVGYYLDQVGLTQNVTYSYGLVWPHVIHRDVHACNGMHRLVYIYLTAKPCRVRVSGTSAYPVGSSRSVSATQVTFHVPSTSASVEDSVERTLVR